MLSLFHKFDFFIFSFFKIGFNLKNQIKSRIFLERLEFLFNCKKIQEKKTNFSLLRYIFQHRCDVFIYLCMLSQVPIKKKMIKKHKKISSQEMKRIQGKSLLKAKVPIKNIPKDVSICKRRVDRLRSRISQRQRESGRKRKFSAKVKK